MGRLMKELARELARDLVRELASELARELARELISSYLRAKQRDYEKARLFKRLTKRLAKRQAMPQIHRRYCKKNSQGGSCPVVHLVLRIQFCVAMVTTAPCSLKFKEKSMISGSANQACLSIYIYVKIFCRLVILPVVRQSVGYFFCASRCFKAELGSETAKLGCKWLSWG